ncbi:MAG: hypothetical protein ACHQ6U_08875 [Thermodesulfobacteriota bacterium]
MPVPVSRREMLSMLRGEFIKDSIFAGVTAFILALTASLVFAADTLVIDAGIPTYKMTTGVSGEGFTMVFTIALLLILIVVVINLSVTSSGNCVKKNTLPREFNRCYSILNPEVCDSGGRN